MTIKKPNRRKSNYELFCTKTGEKVKGKIISDKTAKIIFEDGTFFTLYLTYLPVDIEDQDSEIDYEIDSEFDYKFTIFNFIHEGFVPYGHYTILDQPEPTTELVEKINEVLGKTNYKWSAKDKISISKIPLKTKQNNYWQDSFKLFVRVNGLDFGSILI